MPEVAALSVAVTADTTGLEAGLNRANQSVQGFSSSLGAVGSVLSGIGAGIGMRVFDTVASGFDAAGKAAIGFNSNMEQSTIAFTSMLGSGEKAKAFLDDLKQFAASTPFEFPDLLSASKQMMAFGFAAKDVRPLLEAVGSAASAMGTGRSGVDSITKALGQMRAATVVQAGELNQLTEQGVPAFQILADKMGISTGEVKKLASEGKIASQVFIDAFQEWAKANYGDMMAKQALTFEGAVSNIKDSLTFATAEAFKPFFEVISAGAVQLSNFVQGETFTAWAKTMAATTRDAFRQLADGVRTIQQVLSDDWMPSDQIEPFALAVGTAAVALKSTLGPAIQAVAGFLSATLLPAVQAVGQFLADHTEIVLGFAAALGSILAMAGVQAVLAGIAAAIGLLLSPIALVTAAITVLVAAWIGNWGGIRDVVLAAWTAIEPTFAAMVDWLGAQIPVVLDYLTTTAWPAFVAAATAVSTWITTVAVPALTALVDWLGPKITEVVTWITTTGWPGFVAAATTVSEWITGTAIPALTLLVDWLGTQLQTVTTWITDTGWPALVTAGTAVGTMVTTVTTFFQDLYVELDKRGVFTELDGIWQTLKATGDLLWAAIQKIGEILAPVLVQFQDGKTRGDEMAGALTAMTAAALPAVDPIKAIGAGIQFAVEQVAKGLKPLQDFVAAMQALSQIKLPSFDFGGHQADTSGMGATQLSYGGGSLGAGNGANPNVMRYSKEIAAAAAKYDISPSDLAGLVDLESSGNPNARSGAGAMGLGQVMPFHFKPGENPYDPQTNLDAAARVYRSNLDKYGGDPVHAAAGYFGAGDNFNASDGGATGNDYMRIFQERRRRYQTTPNAGASPGGMMKVPLGGGGPMAPMDGGPLPPFMQETFDSLPDYLKSLDTIQQQGTDTYTQVATVGKAQGLVLAGSQTDALGTVTSVYRSTGGDLITTTTNTSGQVTSQYATMAGGVTLEMGNMALGVETTQTALGNNLMTTTADAAGNYVTTITTMSGQIVSQYAGTATQVLAQTAAQNTGVTTSYDLMASGSLQHVQALADGTTATVSSASGITVTTITDMQGQVVNQYGTMADGTAVRINDMATKSTTTTDAMSGTIKTTMTDMGGNVVTTVTTMSGQVLSVTATTSTQHASIWSATSQATIKTATDMGLQVVGQSRTMGENIVTATKDSTGQMVTLVTDATGKVVGKFKELSDSGKVVASGMDVAAKGLDGVIKKMKDAESQAKKTADAMGSIGGKKGGDGDAKKGAPGKAGGGPVSAFAPYIVGDAGRPELFVPATDGTILPRVPGSGGGGDVYITVEVNGSLLSSRRDIEDAVVAGLESARKRGRA